MLPARFGYLKDFCFGCRGLKHTQWGATLETDECTHTAINWYFVDCCCCQHLNIRTPGCWEATCYWCVHSSICFQCGPTLGVLQASMPKAAVFQVSEPCSSLSRIQITLQQSFRYPNLAAVFHVSKPCSSLSHIQTLQQSFMYPNLAGSSLEGSPQVRQITDFKLYYTRHTHYDIVW